jgi:Helix-turn-helix domain of resolvase
MGELRRNAGAREEAISLASEQARSKLEPSRETRALVTAIDCDPYTRRGWSAKVLLANPDIGVTQIAHRLGVSPATLYRYIPAARTALTPIPNASSMLKWSTVLGSIK